MQVVHDPGDAHAYVVMTLVALPTVLTLIGAGIGAAIIVAKGTLVVLVVWRVFLSPGVMLISEVVDHVRGVPPDQYASHKGKWW